ncbi:MAG TPA: hydrogenase iron-sulfur subunit [bacterium]|nr:hydrogenase iron-sulfur subunit [bacterium]
MATTRPRIVAFLCNWCSYAGADLAGTTRLKHKADVRVVRVPCSGRVDPAFILRAFEAGADAVLVGGCHPGDCHYVRGNLNARRRFLILRHLLAYLGIEEERFQVAWCSAAEGAKWAELVNEICDTARKLGPLKGFKSLGAELATPDKEITLSGE